MRGKGYWAQEIGWNKDLVYVPCYYYFFYFGIFMFNIILYG